LADALTTEEKKTLRDDLDLGNPDNDMGDLYVARIRATSMLARWRDDIEKAVEEGNNCEEYACILKPSAKTEAERVALKLIDFFEPSHAVFDLPAQDGNNMVKSKQINNCQETVQILNGTTLGNGITLTYYSSDSNKDDSVKGTATKLQKMKADQTKEADVLQDDDGISWFVVLANGQTFQVVEEELRTLNNTEFTFQQTASFFHALWRTRSRNNNDNGDSTNCKLRMKNNLLLKKHGKK